MPKQTVISLNFAISGNIEPKRPVWLAVLNNEPSGTIWTNMNDQSSTKA
jgi:hypothetical protein